MTTPLFLRPGIGLPFWILFGAFVVGELVLVVRSRLNRGGQRVRGWPGGYGRGGWRAVR